MKIEKQIVQFSSWNRTEVLQIRFVIACLKFWNTNQTSAARLQASVGRVQEDFRQAHLESWQWNLQGDDTSLNVIERVIERVIVSQYISVIIVVALLALLVPGALTAKPTWCQPQIWANGPDWQDMPIRHALHQKRILKVILKLWVAIGCSSCSVQCSLTSSRPVMELLADYGRLICFWNLALRFNRGPREMCMLHHDTSCYIMIHHDTLSIIGIIGYWVHFVTMSKESLRYPQISKIIDPMAELFKTDSFSNSLLCIFLHCSLAVFSLWCLYKRFEFNDFLPTCEVSSAAADAKSSCGSQEPSSAKQSHVEPSRAS